MTTRAFTGTTRLHYQLHTGPADPTDTAGDTTLTLTATNPTEQHITCSCITLSVPLTAPGPGATALTTTPQTLRAAVNQGWTLTAARGAYTARPISGSLAPGSQLTLTLTGIAPPPTGGTATLFLTEPAPPGGQSPARLPVPVVFWPQGDLGVFRDFYTENSNNPGGELNRGQSTLLHWTCGKGSDEWIKYNLYYYPDGYQPDSHDCGLVQLDTTQLFDSANGYYKANPDNSNLLDFTVPTAPLTNLTVGYDLQALLNDDSAGKHLTTASFVTGGDLDGGSITSLTGSAQILTPSSQNTFHTNTCYHASTDGFLCGTVTDGSTLQVAVTPPGSVLPERHIAAAPNGQNQLATSNTNFTLPIRKDSTLRTFNLPAAADYTLAWHPLGAGDLTPQHFLGAGDLTQGTPGTDKAAAAPCLPTPETPGPVSADAWPPEKIVEEFHPEDLVVTSGHTTHLCWHGTTGSDVEYTLHYSVDEKSADKTIANDVIQKHFTPDPSDKSLGYFSVPTKELTGSNLGVGYHLTATLYNDQHERVDSRELTAESVITGESLVTGNISISGSTHMLQPGKPIRPGINRSYTAPTDGFLFCSVNGNSIQFTITPQSGPAYPPVKLSSKRVNINSQDNTSITLPVRRGSILTFNKIPDDPADCKLSWHPLGTEDLTAATYLKGETAS